METNQKVYDTEEKKCEQQLNRYVRRGMQGRASCCNILVDEKVREREMWGKLDLGLKSLKFRSPVQLSGE